MLSFDDLIEIYAQRLHAQPLLIFDLTKLSRESKEWPRHLFFSFFALMSRFTSYQGSVKALVRTARHDIDTDRSDVGVCVRNIQSLCLLTLWEISRESNGFHPVTD